MLLIERERERESERGREREPREEENKKKTHSSPHPLFSLSKKISTVAFATKEALEEIARVVEGNIAKWWEWREAGADPGVVLENEVVAPPPKK